MEVIIIMTSKKYIYTLSFVFSLFATGLAYAAGSVEILSPSGGDKWVIGHNYQIKWKNNSNFKEAAIYLGMCYLDTVPLEKGYYDITVPSYCDSRSFDINPGNYGIALYLGNGNEDDSIHNAVYGDSIYVVSPVDEDPVPIDGKCGDAHGRTFTDYDHPRDMDTCALGKYTGASGNGDYWKWECKGSFGGKDAECEAFVSHKHPSIIVSTGTENGSEGWILGDEATVWWEAYSVDKVDISFCPNENINNCSYVIAQGVDASKGRYNWSYTQNEWDKLIEGGNFKVKISATSNPSIVEYSEGYVYFLKRYDGTKESCVGLSKLDKDKCLIKVGVSKKDQSYCNLVSDSSKKECYTEMALALSDVSICKWVNSSSYDYAECAYAFTIATKNVSICNSINNPYFREKCLSELTYDVSVCSGLSQEAFKKNCLERVKKFDLTNSDIGKLRDMLLQNKAKKGTYLGVVSAKTGSDLVKVINREGDPINIYTANDSFCMMKKVQGGYYCVDSSGYEGTESNCSNDNMACKKKYDRAQLIARIKKLIQEMQANKVNPTEVVDNRKWEFPRAVVTMNLKEEKMRPSTVASGKDGHIYTELSGEKYGIRSSKIIDGKISDIDFISLSSYSHVVEGDYLYLAGVNGIEVHRVKDGVMMDDASYKGPSIISIDVKDGIIYGGGKDGLYAYKKEGNTLKEIDHVSVSNINDVIEDSGYIYVNRQGQGRISVYRMVNNKFVEVDTITEGDFGLGGGFTILPFAAGNKKLFVATLKGFHAYSLESGKLVEIKTSISATEGTRLYSHNGFLYIAHQASNLLVIYDIRTNDITELGRIQANEYIQSIYVDDNYLYVSHNYAVEIFSIK